MPKQWEFRINGIRLSGDLYPSWDAACSRMFRELNALRFETTGAERDHNGNKETTFIAEHARLRREVPRVDVTVKCLKDGKPRVLQINRLPWGSSPSAKSYTA